MPSIAITPGDTKGIGPAVMAQAIVNCQKIAPATQRVLFGPRDLWTSLLQVLDKDFPIQNLKYVDVGDGPNSRGAQDALSALEAACQWLHIPGNIGICTGPISKERMRKVGFNYPGHTEFLAQIGTQIANSNGAPAPRHCMFFHGDQLKVALVSIHIPLAEAVSNLTSEAIVHTIETVHECSQQIGLPSDPTIWVAGLNPHAGENGLMGNDEEHIITPAVEQCTNKGIKVSGPFPPDTMFALALQQKPDVCIAMYHDQGLIPFKLLHFADGVNCTIGLPFLRTSPDHGTAFALASSNLATTAAQIKSGEIDARSATAALTLLLHNS